MQKRLSQRERLQLMRSKIKYSDVERARIFAERYHTGHQEHGAQSSIMYHLEDVRAALGGFGFSQEVFPKLHIAAYLHDILEDTSCKQSEITEEFGSEVSDLVFRVTDEPGSNRVERKRLTYPKIAPSYLAVVLKLADRIANMQRSIVHRFEESKYIREYIEEYPEFRGTLKTPDTDPEEMWNHLDRLMKVAEAATELEWRP